MPYSTVPFRMTLSDLAKYSMTRSIARPLCDSRATCYSVVVAVLMDTYYNNDCLLPASFLLLICTVFNVHIAILLITQYKLFNMYRFYSLGMQVFANENV